MRRCMIMMSKSQLKYRNVKVVVDGIEFDSKKEANRYSELKLLERANKIKNLQLQPKFLLQDSFKKNGKSYKAITYIADFAYYDNDLKKIVIEDTKGMKTEVYKIKKKMFEYKYNIEIKEI